MGTVMQDTQATGMDTVTDPNTGMTMGTVMDKERTDTRTRSRIATVSWLPQQFPGRCCKYLITTNGLASNVIS